jgi:hypothetical protein
MNLDVCSDQIHYAYTIQPFQSEMYANISTFWRIMSSGCISSSTYRYGEGVVHFNYQGKYLEKR